MDMVESPQTSDGSKDHPPAIRVRRVRLTVVKGPNKGAACLTSESRVRVGKADDNDLVVPHETVSRQHFEIARDAWGYLLRDLESTNGTFLDGAEIREAYIRSGSVITAGQTKIKFRTQEDFLEVTPYPEDTMGSLVGRSAAMRLTFGAVQVVAALDVPVLFIGEPGTGRRSLSHILHRRSPRRNRPILEVLCGTLSPVEIQEELFELHDSDVAFIKPRGGTLILAEPWELGLELQSKIVKALESNARSGRGTEPGADSVRVLSVSSRDLTLEAERGTMDARLASHLATTQIRVPALRHRPEDIDALAERFAGTERPGSSTAGALPEVLLAAFRGHTWPGNIPELKHFVSAWADATGAHAQGGLMALLDSGPEDRLSFRDHKRKWVDTFERHFLTRLMNKCHANVSHAARLAGMDRKYLNNLLKRHGLKE